MKIVVSLVKAGADVSRPVRDGRVAADVARDAGHTRILDVLNDVEDRSNMWLLRESHRGGTDTQHVVIKQVGNGSFGDVYKALHLPSFEERALKVVRFIDRDGQPLPDPDRIARLKAYLQEAEIMFELELHPNIVGLRGVRLLRNVVGFEKSAIDDNLYISLDFASGGPLVDHVQTTSGDS